ncbi:MAG: serine/threonine-protein phosphatase [Phycisphaeraceae bacterium]|nr:serine/threonine-protein phosphatase [Phycisphaeraceae bacterium]
MAEVTESRKLQRANWPALFVGIYLVFAPMPVLLMAIPQRPFSLPYVLIAGTIGGLISVSWAAAFIFRRFAWLAFIVPGSILVPWALSRGAAKLGAALFVAEQSATTHRLLYVLFGICSIIAGYVLLVGVIRRFDRIGARSLAELDVARRMHESIVPSIAISTGQADVFARSEASSEMGGDLIDLVVRDDGREIDLFLADVSGHGVGAGIVMGMLKASIRTRLLAAGDLGSILTDVNRIICDLTKPEMFATLACVRLRPGSVQYAMAGHLPILRISADPKACEEFENQHLPLGVDAPIEFTFGELTPSPGDTLAIFSDGLVEVRNSAGQEFGLAAANALVFEEVVGAQGIDLSLVYDRILQRVRAFGPQFDDQTLLLVRIKQP